MSGLVDDAGRAEARPRRTPLNRDQVVGLWAAWAGWLLDGMDSVLHALVLAPALTEFPPRSGIEATPATTGCVGSIPFAPILVGRFGWASYLPPDRALPTSLTLLFFLGFSGADFALFSPWLPKLFGTEVRATAFAFCTSVGRSIGAGLDFALGAAVLRLGTLGTPLAWTAAAFGFGLLPIPFAVETRGEPLPR